MYAVSGLVFKRYSSPPENVVYQNDQCRRLFIVVVVVVVVVVVAVESVACQDYQ